MHTSEINEFAEAARLMPVVETISLTGRWELHFKELDVRGCRRLRMLALDSMYVQKVFLGAGCRLSLSLQDIQYVAHKVEDGDMAAVPCSLAEHARMHCEDFLEDIDSEEGPGLLALCPRVVALDMLWPYCRNLHLGQEVASLLMTMMPHGGQPLQALRSIIIFGVGNHPITCVTPAALPSLEELVVSSNSRQELSFETPQATFSAIDTFFLLGQPMIMDSTDLASSVRASQGGG